MSSCPRSLAPQAAVYVGPWDHRLQVGIGLIRLVIRRHGLRAQALHGLSRGTLDETQGGMFKSPKTYEITGAG